MRRIVLSFLLILSLTIGGALNAWAAQQCPYLNTEAAADTHDCCPPGAMDAADAAAMAGMSKSDDQHHPSEAPFDCQPGQTCRTTPALAWVPAVEAVWFSDRASAREYAHDLGGPLADVEQELRPPISA